MPAAISWISKSWKSTPSDRTAISGGETRLRKTSRLKILSWQSCSLRTPTSGAGSIAPHRPILDELDLDAIQIAVMPLPRLNVAGVAQETMSGGETRAKITSALSPACKRDSPTSLTYSPRPRRHPPSSDNPKAFDSLWLIRSHDLSFSRPGGRQDLGESKTAVFPNSGVTTRLLRQKEEERKKLRRPIRGDALERADRLKPPSKTTETAHGRSTPSGRLRKKATRVCRSIKHQSNRTKQKRMYQRLSDMEKRLEALEGIEAPDSSLPWFRQSKALELHSNFISADDFSNCMPRRPR